MATDLDRVRALIQQTDPYSGYLGAVNAINYTPREAGQETTAIGVGLGKAILAGLLSAKRDERANEQMSLINRAIPELARDPLGAVMPEGLSPTIYSSLQQEFISEALKREQAKKDLVSSEIIKGSIGLALDDPAMRQQLLKNPGTALAGDLLGSMTDKAPEQPLDAVLATKVDETPVAAKPAFKTVEELRSQGYTTKEANEEIDRQRTRAREDEKFDYDRKRASFDDEDEFRAEIVKMPAVAQFQLSQKALPILEAFKDQDTKSSDVGFVYNYIKALDDGAVKEGEIDLANSANPLLKKFGKELEGVFYAGSTLTPELKNRMFQELQGAQAKLYEAALGQAAPILSIAGRRGFDKENLLPFDPNLKFNVSKLVEPVGEELGPRPSRTPAPPAMTVDLGSVKASDAEIQAMLKKRGLM